MVIVEIETADGQVVVEKRGNDLYDVSRNGVLRHSPCSAEDVMRVLGNYLYSAEYKLAKLQVDK